MQNYLLFSLCLTSYLAGNFMSAVFVAKLLGLPDPRLSGSKNPGATNTLRVSGAKKAFALTLLLDAAKTMLPYLFMIQLGYSYHWSLFAALCAVCGHVRPIHGQGGRGVACAIGFFTIIAPKLALVSFSFWCVLIAIIGLDHAGLCTMINLFVTASAYFMVSDDSIVTCLVAFVTMLLIKTHSLYIPKLYQYMARVR